MDEAEKKVLMIFQVNGLTAGRILYPKQLRHFTWQQEAREREAFDQAVDRLLERGWLYIPDPEMGALALTKTGEDALAGLA